tara:strand:- start:219 stop:482 length:264 start_codon:yes stop_codon:yes gene_type:complete
MPKQFKDLKFSMHRIFPVLSTHAELELDNGYGISVINGANAYCDNETYEVAIKKDGKITYDTEFTNNVLEYQTPSDIDELLTNLEKL